VVTGTQADGSGNRDEVAKPAVPKGTSMDIWPPAKDWHNPEFAGLFGVCCQYGGTLQGSLYQDARYAANAQEALPAGPDLRSHLTSEAVICLDTHGVPGMAYIAGGRVLAAQSYPGIAEPDDVVLSQHVGEYPQLRFVLLLSCRSGQQCPPIIGPSLVSSTANAGADSVLGFHDEIPIEQSAWWAHFFWYHAFETGATVSAARVLAFGDLEDKYGANVDQRLDDVEILGGGVDLVPAGYGQ
jgi:hypothetical protein